MEMWIKINLTLSLVFIVMYLVDKVFDVNKKSYSEVGGTVTITCYASWILYLLARIWL